MIGIVAGALLSLAGTGPLAEGAQPHDRASDRGAAIVVLDLNSATEEELTRLPGIGPRRARAIIARRSDRPYTRVTQLLEVRGIGKKTLERLRPHLRVVPLVPVVPAGEPVREEATDTAHRTKT